MSTADIEPDAASAPLTGSRLRHRYQVATVRHGSQFAATSRASLRLLGSVGGLLGGLNGR